jgi:hypothetical protein
MKMLNPLESEISYLNRVKAQSEVLLPVLKLLRKELGYDRANELVYGALRVWSREVFAEVGSKKEGSGFEIWSAMDAELATLTGDDIEYETLREDAEALDLNVTSCKFAQFFKELGEPELGAILTCEVDHHMAAASQQEVHLDIDKTIMKGDRLCDFRYKFNRTDSDST